MVINVGGAFFATAQTAVWTGVGGTGWNTTTSWDTGNVPNTAGERAHFANAVGVNPIANLTVATNLGQLLFSGATNGGVSGGSTLTLSGIAGVGIDNQANYTPTLSNNYALAGSQTWQTTNVGGGGLNVTGAVALGTNTLTINTVNAANTMSFAGAGAFTGAGTITKTGAGTATINRANSASIVNVNGGKLILTGPDTANNRLANGSTVNVATGATLELQGATNIIPQGAANSADINLNGGSLYVNLDAGGIHAHFGDVSMTNGSSITTNATMGNYFGSNFMIFNTLTMASAGTATISAKDGVEFYATTVNVASGGTLSINTNVVQTDSLTGSITKTGAGTLVLSGTVTTNAYSGGTTINGGTVQISANTNLGATSGGVTLNGGTLQNTATLSTARAVTLGASGGTFLTDTGTVMTASGLFSGTGGLTKTGAGTLTLSTASNNTYSGVTTIAGGVLSIGKDRHLGAVPGAATPGKLVLNGGTLQTTATFPLASQRGIAVGASGGAIETSSGTTLTYAGAIAGSGDLTKTGAGTLALTAALSAGFSGDLNLDMGTLSLASATHVLTNTLTFNGGTLSLLGGADLSIGTLHITGNTIIDFGTTGASTLAATNFIVDTGATLTLNNWTHNTDYFNAANWWTDATMTTLVGRNIYGAAPGNQITFTGGGWTNNDSHWSPYDNQVTPVPEPGTYGAIMIVLCAGAVTWRRKRQSVAKQKQESLLSSS